MAKMFVHYSKTKAEFIAAGLPSTYTNHIVFIKGDANGNGSCVYTHGMYFANFKELIEALNFVKGVQVGTEKYNAAAGGGYVTFAPNDPSTVVLDVANGKITIGLTDTFVTKVNTTATNLGGKGDAATPEGSAFSRIADLYNKYADLYDKYTALVGDEEGSIDDRIADAIEALSGTWGADGAKTVAEVYAAVKAVEANYATKAENKKVADDLATLSGNFNTLSGNVGDVDSLSTTNKVIVDAINEVKVAVGAGGTAAAITIIETGASGDYAQVYEFKQGGTTIGKVNIPKELVVQSGEVVTNPSGKPAGTYIKLKLQNVKDDLYIDVAKLVDVYTAEKNATQVQLAVDASNVISATIVAGSITSVELGANAVITEKIADKNVTKAKLSDAVQTILDGANQGVEVISVSTGTVTKGQIKFTTNPYNNVKAAYDANKTPIIYISNLATYVEVHPVSGGYSFAGSGSSSYGSAVKTFSVMIQQNESYIDVAEAYTKPAAGIPAADLATNSVTTQKITNKNVTLEKLAQGVQDSLALADAAAPQATTYTKDEVDAMWAWEEL